MKQQLLVDDWGCPFYGKAEMTSTGLYYHIDADGRRHPLRLQTIPTE